MSMAFDPTESAFETAIEESLIGIGGYEQGDPADFDRQRGINPVVFLSFVRETQPATWEALENLHGGDTAAAVLSDLCKALDGKKGSLGVLRHETKWGGNRDRCSNRR